MMPKRNPPVASKGSSNPTHVSAAEALSFRLWREQRPLVSRYPAFTGACQKLVALGADAAFVTYITNLLTQDAFLRRHLALLHDTGLSLEEWERWNAALAEMWMLIQSLTRLQKLPGFATLPLSYQDHTDQVLVDLKKQFSGMVEPLYDTWHQIDANDYLLTLLETSGPGVRHRGRPSQARATAFMVFVTDHLRARIGKPHYREVGLEAERIFPGCFTEDVRRNPKNLWGAVQDRCKKFKKGLRDRIEVLQTVILSNPTK